MTHPTEAGYPTITTGWVSPKGLARFEYENKPLMVVPVHTPAHSLNVGIEVVTSPDSETIVSSTEAGERERLVNEARRALMATRLELPRAVADALTDKVEDALHYLLRTEPGGEYQTKRQEAYGRALNRIAGLGMGSPAQMEREDFYRDQLQAAIGLAARTVQVWGWSAEPSGSEEVLSRPTTPVEPEEQFGEADAARGYEAAMEARKEAGRWRDAAIQAKDDLRAVEAAFQDAEGPKQCPIGPGHVFAAWSSPAVTMRWIEAMEEHGPDAKLDDEHGTPVEEQEP